MKPLTEEQVRKAKRDVVLGQLGMWVASTTVVGLYLLLGITTGTWMEYLPFPIGIIALAGSYWWIFRGLD